MIIVLVLVMCSLVIVFQKRYSDRRILNRIKSHFGDALVDYGVYEREGYKHPTVFWGNMSSIIDLIQATQRPYDINVKITDASLLRRVQPHIHAIRIQTPTYHQGLHFDCYNQRVFQMRGIKRWIMFDHDDYENASALIRECNSHTSLDPVVTILTKLNISFSEFYMSPGQTLYIPAGTWHQTEGMEGDVQITMNRIMRDRNTLRRSMLLKYFTHLFPMQKIACIHNECKY